MAKSPKFSPTELRQLLARTDAQMHYLKSH